MMDMKIEENEYSVTDEEFDLAIRAIAEWHRERKVGFALVNTSSLLVAQQGRPLELEAALRHSYEQVHGDTAVKIMQRRQAIEHAEMQSSGQADPDQVKAIEDAIKQAQS
jgi:hypothetical protein